jgi:signal transduction histidine kinase
MKRPATARVFAGEISQVVSNLIIDALDAVPEACGVLSLRVRTLGGKVHISVTDNGTGIAPSMSRVLFEAHQTTKSHGTGLGLWLSKSIEEESRTTARSVPTSRELRSSFPWMLVSVY